MCYVLLNYLRKFINFLQTALYPIKSILGIRKHNLWDSGNLPKVTLLVCQ